MEPGPGVGGPGPGVIPPVGGAMGGMMADGSVMPASFAGGGYGPGGGPCGGPGGPGGMSGMGTSQIAFLGEEGIQIGWDVGSEGQFDSSPIVTPARQDFPQGAIYRLRLSNIPGRGGVELFPTLEVAPVTPRTDAFLAHAPIPVQFTEEDFDQVLSGNFVTKVIYLPDPEFQELALSGVETLVSTRLDPGVDPIAEADRRGSILAIVRIGNKDLRTSSGMANYRSGGVIHASYQADGSVAPAQYCPSGGCYNGGGQGYGGGGQGYGGGDGGGGYYDGGGQMPMGMPTTGFAPQPLPPNMMAGGPTWGMPITGTPIGLPGPPHIPLGAPAGLQAHVMTNRTRMDIPPVVSRMDISVKERPGLNYPRPVNHVTVDEVHREPGGLFGTICGMFSNAGTGPPHRYEREMAMGGQCGPPCDQ
jgi:hypothetical protein